jgi:hypothetical protein
MALSASTVPVTTVRERLGINDLSSLFERLRHDGLDLRIQADAVVFSRPSLVPVTEAELAALKRRDQLVNRTNLDCF